ncbi:hypothetical protein GOP47_0007643 [Adiantum capillus-veneris]|uniref:Uncharacterized protein n=1 Tax=Adiantum capillus-veneris TaxID=13818 RepID=A0A9D4V183_ADICA|nr:hypothetical protein GOP47_0007643 [Adiantum capillus-veneris]
MHLQERSPPVPPCRLRPTTPRPVCKQASTITVLHFPPKEEASGNTLLMSKIWRRLEEQSQKEGGTTNGSPSEHNYVPRTASGPQPNPCPLGTTAC